MNAVLIYDDLHFAARAKAMLERAAHRADEALLWTVKPWPLNMLILPPTTEAALTDAADAHLIVLGLRYPQLPPAGLLDWLEQWATRRQIQDAALAVFDGGNGETLSDTAAPDLFRFAERHGLSFIFGDVGPTADESAVFPRSSPGREVFVTPALEPIMAHPLHADYRGWGLND